MNKSENLKKVTINLYGQDETLIASDAILNYLAVIMRDGSSGQRALGYEAIADTYLDIATQIHAVLEAEGYYDI